MTNPVGNSQQGYDIQEFNNSSEMSKDMQALEAYTQLVDEDISQWLNPNIITDELGNIEMYGEVAQIFQSNISEQADILGKRLHEPEPNMADKHIRPLDYQPHAQLPGILPSISKQGDYSLLSALVEKNDADSILNHHPGLDWRKSSLAKQSNSRTRTKPRPKPTTQQPPLVNAQAAARWASLNPEQLPLQGQQELGVDPIELNNNDNFIFAPSDIIINVAGHEDKVQPDATYNLLYLCEHNIISEEQLIDIYIHLISLCIVAGGMSDTKMTQLVPEEIKFKATQDSSVYTLKFVSNPNAPKRIRRIPGQVLSIDNYKPTDFKFSYTNYRQSNVYILGKSLEKLSSISGWNSIPKDLIDDMTIKIITGDGKRQIFLAEVSDKLNKIKQNITQAKEV